MTVNSSYGIGVDDKKGVGADEGGEEERGCDADVVEHGVGESD